MTTSDYAPKQIVPGTQYRVVRLIGAGGHGSVYAVEHTFLEAPAVMKVLHGDLVGEGNLADRMTREAKTLAKLRHPNIVEVRDGGLTAEDPPRPFFVMEPLKGMPLREMLRQVPHGLGMLPSLQIAVGVLNGLHYAHAAGVVHRDIKPDNIFLHKSMTDVTVPKLLDFGIAHLFLGKHLTGKHFLGTPRYAAPEQIRGEPPVATTDIYAVGLVLYEMLTGEAPFAHLKEIVPICTAHCEEMLPPVSRRVPEAPKVLDDFVQTMLAKDAKARPPTAFAAAVMLREIRQRIETAQSKGVHSPDFKTEPTPMENALVEMGPDGQAIVAESVRRPTSGGTAPNHTVNDTVVGAPNFDTIQNPAFSPTEPATTPKPQGIDRNAPTRSSPRDKPMARRIPNFDTHVTDIQPESGPPSPRSPVSSNRDAASDPTPSAVVGPAYPERVPSAQAQSGKIVPVVIAGALTILALSAITIPIGFVYMKRSAQNETPAAAPAPPPPQPVVPSAPPPVVTVRVTPAAPPPLPPTTTASAEPAPPAVAAKSKPAPAPVAPNVAASGAQVRKPAAAPASSKLIDPSSIGYE